LVLNNHFLGLLPSQLHLYQRQGVLIRQAAPLLAFLAYSTLFILVGTVSTNRTEKGTQQV
jgi:hypothetical protein